ncbi:hypothetical protein BU17DRAFT_49899 [Hysterangium stoloniferum]|nr:hypothetical protein BU17DRAFT_49899 [Hysterangium stoloniferum]
MPHTIALAGFLLEYPVSYLPDPDPNNKSLLSNIALDVFECSIAFLQTSHVFMRFSRPASLAPLAGVLANMLQERFHNRIYAAGIEEMTIDISHRTVTMDRVAL